MDITLKLSKDFERCLEDLKKKYGEDFEYINGVHPSQLDFSEFIDNFVDKDTLADASIDPNANANHKDIRSFMTEKIFVQRRRIVLQVQVDKMLIKLNLQ